MRRGMTVTAIAVMLSAFALASVGPAWAGGGHGHRYHHRGHHGYGGLYLLGGLIGGLLLADALSRPRYREVPVYSRPPVRARYDCKPTTGTGYRNGSLAAFGGTFCYDANGVGYVVSGSEYFIGYVQ